MTFFTARSNIFYLELAIDRTEFIKLNDFDAEEALDPDDLINAVQQGEPAKSQPAADASSEQDELLKSLGM